MGWICAFQYSTRRGEGVTPWEDQDCFACAVVQIAEGKDPKPRVTRVVGESMSAGVEKGNQEREMAEKLLTLTIVTD